MAVKATIPDIFNDMSADNQKILHNICLYLSSAKKGSFEDKNGSYPYIWDGTIFFDFVKPTIEQESKFISRLNKWNVEYKSNFRRFPKESLGVNAAKVAFCVASETQSFETVTDFLRAYIQSRKEQTYELFSLSENGLKGIPNASGIIKNLLSNPTPNLFASTPLNEPIPYRLSLDIPESNEEMSINNYVSEVIDIIGRDDEKEQLLSFLNGEHKHKVSWFQLAGVAGQGKSRLGLWLINQVKDLNWNAGFLFDDIIEEMGGTWQSWQPEVPHLIVFDYVIGRTDEIGKIIRALAMRSEQLHHEVKILLLERQPCYSENIYKIREKDSNSYREINAFNSKAPWFIGLTGHYDANVPAFYKTRFNNGFLRLKALEKDDLLSIVKKVHAIISDSVIEYTDDEIFEKLKKIDVVGRPLYAYFFAQEIVFGRGKGEWSKEELLNNTLLREMEYWWKAEFKDSHPYIGSDMPSSKLALLATMTGEVDCNKAEELGIISYMDYETRKEATVLNGGIISSSQGTHSSSKIIKPMQPDLLGEWFVLSSLVENISLKSLLNLALKYSVDGTTTFIIHALQDFSDYVYKYGILNDINYDLITLESLNKLLKITIEFEDVPEKLIFSAKKRLDTPIHDNQYADFHYNLGVCYRLGCGVEKDIRQSEMHYSLAAAGKSASAMFNVAEKYINGDNEQKMLAFSLYEESARKGNDSSVYKLALCYELGEGTPVLEDEALFWHKKSTEFGHVDSMYFVAKKYECDKQYSNAFYWYELSAEGAYLPAMAALASCYEYSKGVAENYKKAYYWHREVLSHRDWVFWRGDTFSEHLALSQYKLGCFYEHGYGVAKRKAKAFYLYREAAIGGGALAMVAVARCYKKGIGVSPNKIKSQYWHEQSSKENNNLYLDTFFYPAF